LELQHHLEYVEKLRDWMVSALSRMVEVPTVNPPGRDYDRFVSVVEDLLAGLGGVEVKVHEVPRSVVEKYYPDYADNPRYIIIARLRSGRGPVLHINGHYDVVPPGSGWTVDPFKPVVREGKLYGRGAADMKGGIASAILALRVLAEKGVPGSGVLEVSMTPDEETGGETGVKYMLEQGLVRPDYAIVAEPSGVDNIWFGNKGAVWAMVEVFGKQAHGSTPWHGVNAFEKMVELAYLIMKELKPRIESRRSRYEFEEPEGAKATITIGGEVKGGAKVNVVPGYYAFSVDRRVIPEESADEAARELVEFVENAAKRIPGLKARVKIVSKFDATVTDPDSPFIRALTSAVREVMGIEPRRTVCIGGLDTRYFQERGIPAATYGPGDSRVAHIADEYIELRHVMDVAKVYVALASKLFSG
jgi:succinyl-diaminopimelate desuccinylase